MPTLTIGTRSFAASDARVIRQADRLFKLTPAQRAGAVERAKTALARAGAKGDLEDDAPGGVKHAVAVLLSQGIREI